MLWLLWVPRAMSRVKNKATIKPQLLRRGGQTTLWKALGAIDLHFHGAYDIDLMTAEAPQLNHLSKKLYNCGVSAFLPTTLSDSVPKIEASLNRLGSWIADKQVQGPILGEAFPLGIHLEGPFIAKACCGAHPEKNLLAPSLPLLKRWMALSQGTLTKITLAPELTSWRHIREILHWAKKNQITMSIGHSQSDSKTTLRTLDCGARSLTHAWNAMPFHHRNPGILGAALGRKDLFVEIIPDNVHVSDTVVNWTLTLHPEGVCWVSDAVPAAETQKESAFGPLKVQVRNGAGRTASGALAGGGYTLFRMIARFWSRQKGLKKQKDEAFQRLILQGLTEWPAASLPSFKKWFPHLVDTHSFKYQFGKKLKISPLSNSLNS